MSVHWGWQRISGPGAVSQTQKITANGQDALGALFADDCEFIVRKSNIMHRFARGPSDAAGDMAHIGFANRS